MEIEDVIKYFLSFEKLFENVQHLRIFKMYLGFGGLFCIIDRYFEYRIRILCN